MDGDPMFVYRIRGGFKLHKGITEYEKHNNIKILP
jgi:hypothetical protein